MIAIAITTIGILPSCSSQSGTSSNTSTYSSPRASISETPGTSSQENQTSSSTSPTSDQDSTVGEDIAMRIRRSYGRIRYLTRWNNLSTRQIAGLADEICTSYDGGDTNQFAARVSRVLGGQDDAGSLTEAHIIIVSSMQSSCRGTYSQYTAKMGLEILRSR